MDSSINTATLAEARAIVAAAEAAAEAKEHSRLTDLLQNEIDGLRKATAEHDALVATIKPQRDAVAAVQSNIHAARDRINDWLEEQPEYADLLPNDPGVVAWKLHYRELEADLEQLVAELRKLPDPNLTVVKCNRYEGVNGLIGQHKFAIANIRRRLEGKSDKAFVPNGGISGVR
jgi:hypothetical protein